MAGANVSRLAQILKEHYMGPVLEQLNNSFTLLRALDKDAIVVKCELCGWTHELNDIALMETPPSGVEPGPQEVVARLLYQHYRDCPSNEEVKDNFNKMLSEAKSLDEREALLEQERLDRIQELIEEMEGRI